MYAVGAFVCGAYDVILMVLTETTPGVYQASGYGDLASDKSIWFVLLIVDEMCRSFSSVPLTGSGSLPHATRLTLPPSLHGLMAA